mmetsp:Transcript_4975/g.12469  ORF Transcript_4975/g.12469 Transcript_4975/m.12469 type:complete len:226 (-) Transcript_4975:2191-2868(-)
MRPAAAACFSSSRHTIFSNPMAFIVSRSTQQVASIGLYSHFTSYSYFFCLFFRRLKMQSGTTGMSPFSPITHLRTTPDFESTHHFTARSASSSTFTSLVWFSNDSRSSLPAKRQRMYWTGVLSKCFSKWWNACWATYARRIPEWRKMVPVSFFSSPISSLMAVDLPAPFGPITAIREAMHTDRQMSCTVFFSCVGYLKLTIFIFRIERPFDFTPSSGPGGGKTNF